MPGGLGAPELLLVAGVLILLFGAKKLPEMARSLGKAKGEFKKGLDEGDAERAGKAGAGQSSPPARAPENKSSPPAQAPENKPE